jgi:glutamyl-tRNA reductase
LQSIAEQSLALRRQQIAAGEGIIAEHVSDFCAWIGSAGNKPAPQASEAPGALDETALRTSQL